MLQAQLIERCSNGNHLVELGDGDEGADRAHRWAPPQTASSEIDIDGDAELVRLYDVEVPVVTINGRKAFKYKVDMNEFLKKLAASV